MGLGGALEWTSEQVTDLNVDGLVKVLVLLDESLHAVQGVALIIAVQEGLPSRHPVLGLLTVPAKELWEENRRHQEGSNHFWSNGVDRRRTDYLELQALVQHHAPLNPGLLQVGTLPVQSLQLLLDLRTGIVTSGQQLLAELFEGLEGSGASVDLRPVFLKKQNGETVRKTMGCI